KRMILLYILIICIIIFTFFFSSRRRHTRCLSDWSSDVCSSDLPDLRRHQLLLLHRHSYPFPARPARQEQGSPHRSATGQSGAAGQPRLSCPLVSRNLPRQPARRRGIPRGTEEAAPALRRGLSGTS